MNFHQYLIDQAMAHPATQPQDIIKQCYQAAFGAEHLLTDQDRARAYLEQEYASVPANPQLPLYEIISSQVCRVNLGAWKQHDLPLEWLFRMFVASANISFDRDEAIQLFLSYLDTADRLIRNGQLSVSFSASEWAEVLTAYRAQGICAIHHSEAYRQAEYPAYRILRYEYARLFPILESTAEHFRRCPQTATLSKDTLSPSITADPVPCILAIDGRAASGKTTMADQLARILNAEVIHMDDFFLPPLLRTEKRLQIPGGNVHYERFAEEVLPHLHASAPFSYRRFDCSIMDYHGTRTIGDAPIRIVEGSYSHHPALDNYADIRVFSHVEPGRQMDRILRRNGPQMAEMFRERWIPMEESYFREYEIAASSQVIIDSTYLF